VTYRYADGPPERAVDQNWSPSAQLSVARDLRAFYPLSYGRVAAVAAWGESMDEGSAR
jgi:hypothetical protein